MHFSIKIKGTNKKLTYFNPNKPTIPQMIKFENSANYIAFQSKNSAKQYAKDMINHAIKLKELNPMLARQLASILKHLEISQE